MRYFVSVSVLCLYWLAMAGLASAQSPATQAEIEAAFIGKTVSFGSNGGQGAYAKGGQYTFIGNSMSSGTYTITNGRICVLFTSGFRRCDQILKDGNSFVMIAADKTRFPLTFK